MEGSGKIRLVSNKCDTRRTAAGPWFCFLLTPRTATGRTTWGGVGGTGHTASGNALRLPTAALARGRGLTRQRAPRRIWTAQTGANYGTGVLCKSARARLGARRDRHPGWEGRRTQSSVCSQARVAARSLGGEGARETEWPRRPDGPARAELTAECRTAARGLSAFPLGRRETACPRGPSRLACVTS